MNECRSAAVPIRALYRFATTVVPMITFLTTSYLLGGCEAGSVPDPKVGGISEGQFYENLLTKERMRIKRLDSCASFHDYEARVDSGLNAVRAEERRALARRDSSIKAEIASWYKEYQAGKMSRDAYFAKAEPLRASLHGEPYVSSIPPYRILGLREKYRPGEMCALYIDPRHDDHVVTLEDLAAGYELIR